MSRRPILAALAGLVLLAFAASMLAPLLRRESLEGKPAPALTLPVGADDTERVRLLDQRGKVVVLDFWASWCGPCRHSVPLLNRVAERYADEVQVLGINSEALGPGQVAFVAMNWGIRYPVLRDAAMEAQLAYGVEVFPTVVLIDREGVVAKVYRGEPTEASLDREIENLLE